MKYFTALLVILCIIGASMCEGRLRSSRRRLGFVQNGWNRHNNAAIKYGPQVINAVRTWGPAVKHCVNGICGMDTMDDEDEQVGGFVQNGWNRHNNAAIKYGPQIINGVRKWGPAVKHCVNGICGMDTMDDEDEQVGGFAQTKCKPGEFFDTCHSACPLTCDHPYPRMCRAVCRAGCDCVKGYVRDTTTKKCIPRSYCPWAIRTRRNFPTPKRL